MLDMWTTFLICLVMVTIATEAITEILVSSALLDIIGLRPWAVQKAIPSDPNELEKVCWYHTALYKLLTCGYCQSVWIAFIMAWFLPGDWFGMTPWNNILIKIFLTHRLANFWHVIYELVRRGRVNTIDLVFKLAKEENSDE